MIRDGVAARYSNTLVRHSRLVVAGFLVVSLVVGAGALVGETEDAGIGEFEVDAPETTAQQEIAATYGEDDTIVAQVVVREENGDVLTRESLLAGLYLQRDILEDEAIADTLAEPPFQSLENIVASQAVREERSGSSEQETSPPSLDEQIGAMEALSASELDALLATVLEPGNSNEAYAFLPTTYEPGSTTAEARIAFITQTDTSEPGEDPQAAFDAQVEMAKLVSDRFDDAFVFGQGITNVASSEAVGDSFIIITPVALVLVLFILGITYRDVVDVLVGLFGIGLVLIWLNGIMGWLDIPMSQLLIAVPFLLIGLAIDYALHVIMRYREARAGSLTDGVDETVGIERGMGLGLAGVVLALAAATVSTGIGFFSNVVSPLPAIQDFALLSGAGILATFLVFAVFVPALKVQVDRLLEHRFGWTRAKSPFGFGVGPVNRLLGSMVALARRAPVSVIVVAFLLATAGAYGATGIDTEFNEADFLPQDSPDWAKSLPGPFATGEYTIADDAAYVGENFRERGAGSQAEILIRGSVTDPDALQAIDSASGTVDEDSTIMAGADGSPAIVGPHTLIRDLAAENAKVRAAVNERDVTGNGLPDEDVGAVYDLLYEIDEERASAVLYRTDGTYETARLLLDVRGDAAAQDVATDTRTIADMLEEYEGISAVATGGPVTTAVIQDALLETLVQAFVVTLAVIIVFLTVLYWIRHRALTLGIVTVAPVVAALAWLLGAMAVLDIPFNSETAVITSLAIGLGVDYSIHLSERFLAERETQQSLDEALRKTITGTGGALLGSAATTATGFGVLALALAPPIRRFGLVTGTSIVLAFLACLTVLPALLLLRERLLVRWEQRFR